MSGFVAKLLREVLVLVACLALFPLAVLLLLFYTDSLHLGIAFISRELFSGGVSLGGSPLTLWVKWLTPYLVVQAIRSFLWTQRSLTGRKWGNLYFSVLFGFMAAWSFWRAWDFFYFMYQLGGIPRDLMQFFQLEYHNIAMCVVCLILSIYCFRIFLHPEKSASRNIKHRESGHSAS